MTIETYKIESAFPWTEGREITIESDNLFYSELNDKMSGCQSNSKEHNEEIRSKCKQIAKLIREIENLNPKL